MNRNSIPIYILNLDKSPERFEAVSEQLTSLGLEPTRISGVDGSLLSEQELEVYCKKLNKKNFRHTLSKGEIGCYLAHRKVWQKIIADRIERAIILEDDVIFHQHFAQVVQAFSSLNNVELVKFHSAEGDYYHQSSPLENGLIHVNYKRIPNCAAAYGLTNTGAQKLLARNKIFRPVDWDMQFSREFDIAITGIQPYSVDQRPDIKSDIANVNRGAHGHRATNFWRNIRFRLSVLKHRTFHVSGQLD